MFLLRIWVQTENKNHSYPASGLSKEDIDKWSRTLSAEEDKKRREAIEIRNQADNAIYAVDKTINELGDKVTEDQKQKVNEAKEELSKALEGDDIEKIKEKMKALDSALHEISTAIYQQQAQAQQGEQQGQARVNDDNVVDAEYTEADDAKKNGDGDK